MAFDLVVLACLPRPDLEALWNRFPPTWTLLRRSRRVLLLHLPLLVVLNVLPRHYSQHSSLFPLLPYLDPRSVKLARLHRHTDFEMGNILHQSPPPQLVLHHHPHPRNPNGTRVDPVCREQTRPSLSGLLCPRCPRSSWTSTASLR